MNDKQQEQRNSTGDAEQEGQADFPAPIVEESMRGWRALITRPSRLWWVTGATLLIAITLSILSGRTEGTLIQISFRQGHGIKPGDVLRYRGIDVGEVETVELQNTMDGVLISVRLESQATDLARAESRFWIERPQVGLDRVRGLETVVGAKFLSVLPGPTDGPRATVFEGVETPPLLEKTSSDEILIRFREGHGVEVGDLLKHRGIAVGEVTAVTLNNNLSGVQVRVRLVESASSVACVGSKFWVERPRIAVTEVRGLDTLVSGSYLAVAPGASDAEPQSEFDGLDEPPTGALPEGGLEIALEASQRQGLKRGIPITYRGLTIGHVISVGLARDSASVEARAFIQPQFKHLVREGARFWNNSGIQIDVGISGFQLTADSLETVLSGGVAMAVPENSGPPVPTGSRFAVSAKPEKDWMQWRPRIAARMLQGNQSLPQPHRAALTWRERTFGIARYRNRTGWVLVLDNKTLAGPSSLLVEEAKAIDDTKLEVAGKSIPIKSDRVVNSASGISLLSLGTESLNGIETWPLKRTRQPSGPEDCLVVGAPQAAPLSLTKDHLTLENGVWNVDPVITVDNDWHGASVISVKDGSLIGILAFAEKKPTIVPWQTPIESE